MSSGIHTKKGTYRKANWALGLSALGLVVAYPFQGAFLGGLLTSGCSAALVGGLADWFAVNALFRRPLGIRPGRIFRTEIIPRNRERIFIALTDMVQNELLSQEALKGKLSAYDFSAPILRVWKAEGRQSFEEPLIQLLEQLKPSFRQAVEGLEPEWGRLLKEEHFQREQVAPFVGQVLYKIVESIEGKKAIEILIKNLSVWAQSPEVHQGLVRWLENSITRYVNDNSSRRFLTMFLPQPSALATRLQEQIVDYLQNGMAQGEVEAFLKKKVDELANTDSFSKSKGLGKFIQYAVDSLGLALTQTLGVSESPKKMSRYLLNRVEVWVGKLTESREERTRLNTQVQSFLLPLIENQHTRIGKIVQEGLERYSDERLVELIESKAGEDLQMIRINGSVVGGLVGMLIYIVNWLL
jgi:uncharacterized membrane-anchored protein YjiN (DUF445 family)